MSSLINNKLEICLKVVGLWPYKFNYIGPLLLLSTLITTLPFQCWNAVSLMENPILLMDSLSDILAEVLIFIKLFAMWYNISDMKDLICTINDDWDRKILPNEWKTLAHYCNMFCLFDVCLYMSAVVFYYPDMILAYIKKPSESRILLFQSHYPFDYHESPNYELVLLVQIIQGYAMLFVDSLSKTLLIAFIFHVVARVHLLKGYIDEYNKSCIPTRDKEVDQSFEKLKRVINEHVHILMLVKKIDAAYNYISFFQILFSNIIICVTGFVIITAMESSNLMLMIKFVLYILAMVFQAFTFCIVGQYLRNKGESILHMIYNCLWYNTKQKDIKAIIFIISNAQDPLTLNGGNLFELSINCFTQILKTAASYLSVLRAVYS